MNLMSYFRKVGDKLDKSKKMRLSLDKFVPKNKPVSIYQPHVS